MSQRLYKRTCLDCFTTYESKSRSHITADYYRHLDFTGHSRQRVEDGVRITLV